MVDINTYNRLLQGRRNIVQVDPFPGPEVPEKK